MINFRCIVEYDGTDFNGWGRQPGQRTVQGEVEKALSDIFKYKITVTCAGRTDKGVHASGQCISFKLHKDTSIPPEKLTLRINSILPPDISIKTSAYALPEFDARKSAKSKIYLYIIYNSPERSALYARNTWHIPRPLDIKKMTKAAVLLKGKHDFSVFDSYNSVFDYKFVDLKDIKVVKRGSFVFIMVQGDRFLYKMVRKITGEMARIGKGELDIKSFQETLKARDKKKIGKPAPAKGLYLTKVYY